MKADPCLQVSTQRLSLPLASRTAVTPTGSHPGAHRFINLPQLPRYLPHLATLEEDVSIHQNSFFLLSADYKSIIG